jgi:hypothetical protein
MNNRFDVPDRDHFEKTAEALLADADMEITTFADSLDCILQKGVARGEIDQRSADQVSRFFRRHTEAAKVHVADRIHEVRESFDRLRGQL